MKVKAGVEYIYEPTGFDVFDPRTSLVEGDIVRVVSLPGCPPPNTMGHAHVADVDTGELLGLVQTASLQPLISKEEA